MKIYVIIPALNEEKSIGRVLNDIPENFVTEVVVSDNGSTDNTAEVSKQYEATVTSENERGYGAACLKAMFYLSSKARDEDIIIFLDGDYSDYPEEMISLTEPIVKENYDLVIGSRILGKKNGMTEAGSLLPQAVFGNHLSVFLINLIWGYKFTDLGPFRAIRYGSLIKMKMKDRNYGWTIEMQVKAAIMKLKTTELPVSYRKRTGTSKVTGTISGSLKAGIKILWIIFIYIFKKEF